jgi:hypothetical protein
MRLTSKWYLPNGLMCFRYSGVVWLQCLLVDSVALGPQLIDDRSDLE